MNKKHVSVWGRNLEEYKRMFVLDNMELYIKIVSIADGPSTFNMEQRKLGINVISVDPIYNLNVDELNEVFKQSYIFNKVLFLENKEQFNFRNEEEMEELLAKRESTFNLFIEDYKENRNYYHYGKLPKLDFESNSFNLCICSNFLFIFDHIFNLEFHIESLKEILRLSKEVRIFPLYNIEGKESDYLSAVIEFLDNNKYSWTIESNDYHVYKNGNRFLKIKQ